MTYKVKGEKLVSQDFLTSIEQRQSILNAIPVFQNQPAEPGE